MFDPIRFTTFMNWDSNSWIQVLPRLWFYDAEAVKLKSRQEMEWNTIHHLDLQHVGRGLKPLQPHAAAFHPHQALVAIAMGTYIVGQCFFLLYFLSELLRLCMYDPLLTLSQGNCWAVWFWFYDNWVNIIMTKSLTKCYRKVAYETWWLFFLNQLLIWKCLMVKVNSGKKGSLRELHAISVDCFARIGNIWSLRD